MKIRNERLRLIGTILLSATAMLVQSWTLSSYFGRGLRGGLIAGTAIGAFIAHIGWRIALTALVLTMLALAFSSLFGFWKSWWKMPVIAALIYPCLFYLVFVVSLQVYRSGYFEALSRSVYPNTGAPVDPSLIQAEAFSGIVWTGYIGFILTCVISLVAYFGSKVFLLIVDRSPIEIDARR